MNLRAPFSFAWRKVNAFNSWFGLLVTNGVGTMWCAYLFVALAIDGAPGEIKAVGFPTWLAQSFIQLVLLSVIMVGQNVQGVTQNKQAKETHDAVMDLHAKHDSLAEAHADLAAKLDTTTPVEVSSGHDNI